MGLYAFKKHQRLLKTVEFKFVFAQPYRISNHFFTVLARTNQREQARLGLVISKKHIKQATQRNHVKRLIRESFRVYQHRLAGWDCVVLAKTEASQASNYDLLTAIARQWQQLASQSFFDPDF